MSSKPNVLIVLTDQQSAHMMSCAGNPWLHTPAMDALAARGVRFDRAYCTNAVCIPSRFSLMTGRMPSEIGMRSNERLKFDSIPQEMLDGGLGWLMRRAGYDTAYAGKEHLPARTSAEQVGFDYLTGDERYECAQACADYLRRPHEKPFCLVASFINPHDICMMAIRDSQQTEMERGFVHKWCLHECDVLDEALQRPEGVSEEEFFAEHCPPLPPNFEPQIDEPEAIQRLIESRPFRLKARREWSDRRWREHRWAYARLTERVDAQIAQVLDALRESGHEDDTIVIFTSDHGDNDASHRLEHKTVFYREAVRVPLIVAGPGVLARGALDTTHLTSNGLDLLPTLCDYAGVSVPTNLAGRSFRPIVEGRCDDWREHLCMESEIGRMIVTDGYKYMLHDEGAHREQLLDMSADPHETRNAIGDAGQREVLAAHRKLFATEWPDGEKPT